MLEALGHETQVPCYWILPRLMSLAERLQSHATVLNTLNHIMFKFSCHGQLGNLFFTAIGLCLTHFYYQTCSMNIVDLQKGEEEGGRSSAERQ